MAYNVMQNAQDNVFVYFDVLLVRVQYMHGWLDGWVAVWMHGWMDGWMDGCVDVFM